MEDTDLLRKIADEGKIKDFSLIQINDGDCLRDAQPALRSGESRGIALE
jgi:hypothetical protein